MSAPTPVRRKFNPGTLQSDREIIDQFVVRHREFGILMDIVRHNVGSEVCQHTLIVAPRGRGKTMMLARVAAELRTREALRSTLLPVRFMEESYEVFDVGEFWLDALFHLAPEVVPHDAEKAAELRQAHAEFARRWRGRDLEEHARGVVLETAQRLGRKVVLMVENCQTLFENVDERFGWSLRKTLQTEPNVVFLGTATTRMAALDDVHAPFYEFFRPLLLAPLPLDECKTLWEAASGETRSEREIRPLQILTGGDPRLLVIIAGFARHRSLKELLGELVSLIDDHTEYFRSHLEGLGKTERRVYLALIGLWRPSTTAEIAARSRQETRAVSSLLGRLVKRGAVAYEGKGQKRLYSVTQRLYSIYYKLRRQRDEAAVVQSLIQWMVACFTGDELAAMDKRLATEAIQSSSIREGWTRTRALLAKGEHNLAFRALQSAYDQLVVNEDTPVLLLHYVPELIALGLTERELLRVLVSDPLKSETMSPIIATLRSRLGESVRVPVEIREVAKDLAAHIDKEIERTKEAPCL